MAQNRLAQETSPYLRQHADNPVDWYAWGPDAFARAEAENKPVLLSIGYAACHWCHVMAHESFESPEIAELLNRHFVNIKVDREERPDLDQLYQTALALMGQHGGWPLTMFLTPDGEPFWGGTYFPPAPKWGQPGLPQVVEKVSELYHQQPELIADNRERLKDALTRLYDAEATPGDLSADILDSATEQILGTIDWQNGGTQGAPKFPQPYLFELSWRSYKRRGDARARDAALLTLRQMSQGGIYDHLGGGYARYSVDDHWLVPHFEKMLYDNGQILDLLLHAWRETGEALFKERIYETVGWLLREMRLDSGAFAASLDADSEGVEGKFYVWDAAEIDSLLGDQAALFKEVYDVRSGGNWEGTTILNRLAAPEPRSDADERALAEARSLLFSERETRVHPGRDDKILTDWNGLAIGPLAEAGAVFEEADWLRAAEAAFAFFADMMTRQEDGLSRLSHSHCAGRRQETAVLDDYANMAKAALTLFEVTGQNTYLETAKAWAETAKALFRDAETGGFYQSPADADDLFLRPRTATDHAIPNGNGTMASVFAKLYHLTYDETYRRDAETVIRAFGDTVPRQPIAFASLLNGFDDLLHGPQITLLGPPESVESWKQAVLGLSLPGRAILSTADPTGLPAGHPAADQAPAQSDGPCAFVCRGGTCSLPITDTAHLKQTLEGGET